MQKLDGKTARVLLFDLGGVLVHWDGIDPLLRLSRRGMKAEDARRFWLESPWVRKFERGQCGPVEFAKGVIKELDLSLTQSEFLEEFLSWDRGPLPGAAKLLAELKEAFTLACLSNNNELHGKRLREERGFSVYFEYSFLSHEIGHVKPDREVFEYVLQRLPYQPNEILFFDDNPECVSGAQDVGIPARVVKGPASVRNMLRRLQLFPA
jgi:putative hydrolase of the HAD superfamily